MKLTGIIKEVCDIRTIEKQDGDKIQTRQVVIEEVNADHPQSVAVELQGKKAEEFDMQRGDMVEVTVNVRAWKYMGRDGKEQYGNSFRYPWFRKL